MGKVKLYEIFFATVPEPDWRDRLAYLLCRLNFMGVFNGAIRRLFDSKYWDVDSEKFVESLDLEPLDVWTDSGYSTATRIHITKPYDVYTIATENGRNLSCADDHLVYGADGECVKVRDLRVGDLIVTDGGLSAVDSIALSDESAYMCDLELDGGIK